MPPVTLANCWRIVAQFPRSDGDLVQNTFHVNGAATSQAELQTFADFLAENWDSTGWHMVLRETVGAPTFIVYDLNPGNPIAAEDSATQGSTGNGTDTPSELAAVITLRTGLRGRSFRGRSYIGPLDNDMIGANGALDQGLVGGQALLDAFQTYWSNIDAFDSGTGTHSLMVASFTLGVITPVNRIELDNQVDHQQSRAILGDAVIAATLPATNSGT